MEVKMKVPKFGGNRKLKCSQDPNTKQVICHSYREHKDGTRQELASLKAQVDGSCIPTVTEMSEQEEGELKKLEDKVVGRITAKCKKTNVPDDY